MHPPTTPRLRSAAIAGVSASLALTLAMPATAAPPTDPETPPEFTRIDVDTAVQGASFTVVGEIFAGEQNIVTVGYGALDGRYPAGGGTMQVYRPGNHLSEWHKTAVFDVSAEIVFPNQPTIVDVDDDGDNDIVIPYGYFFDTNPDGPISERGGIAWFENLGQDGSGEPLGFDRHDVIDGQPWSYHGVQYVDLDGDGYQDLISVGEQGKVAERIDDDEIALQFFRGGADQTFEAPITLADAGGSLPVVFDVNGDGLLDIVSSQYFDIGGGSDEASFLWFENVNSAPTDPITAASFERRTIATMYETEPGAGNGVGNGFQIRPVPDFRGDGQVAWVATNHTNRCMAEQMFLPPMPEAVFEFTPGDDIRAPWAQQVLSNTSTPALAPDCPDDFVDATMPIYPGDAITSRRRFGQAAPGVFGYGDIDGDGDIDLAVSGDGDRRLFWIEQKGDGSTLLHTLTAPGEQFGQSGGAAVADLDGNGSNEMVFSSFDQNTVAIWAYDVPEETEEQPKPVTVTSTLAATTSKPQVRAGGRTPVSVTLTGLTGGGSRSVSAAFVPARNGRALSLGALALRETTPGRYTGTLQVPVSESGSLRLTYAGTTVSGDQDTAATTAVTLTARSTVKGFRTGKKRVRANRKLTSTARLTPGFKRQVRLQVRTCKGSSGKCGWKNAASKRTNAKGKVTFKLKARGKRSQWRVVAPRTKAGTKVVSGTRTLIRR